MKNIHILPTKKPSILYAKDDNYKLANSTMAMDWYISSAGYKPYNIYITSDEEIKEGDWFITDKNTICKCVRVDWKYAYSIEAGSRSKNNCKKIILTTDQDLIKDGVQVIDDDFLEWFVKNPSCEMVEVVLDDLCFISSNYEKNYKIIIPKEIGFKVENGKRTETFYSKEEPKTNLERLPFPELVEEFAEYYKKVPLVEEPKQETLEEDAKRYATDMSGTYYEDLYNAFINGAKWQQEQDKNKYSAEEHTDILEVGQILVNEEALEYGLLQYIKICLECNNESQAIRLLEKYGFEKQEERYSEEEVLEILNKFSASCYSPIEKFEIPEWLKKNKNK